MLDNEPTGDGQDASASAAAATLTPPRRRRATKAAGTPAPEAPPADAAPIDQPVDPTAATDAPVKKATRNRAKKVAPQAESSPPNDPPAPAKKATRSRAKKAAATAPTAAEALAVLDSAQEPAAADTAEAPAPVKRATRSRAKKAAPAPPSADTAASQADASPARQADEQRTAPPPVMFMPPVVADEDVAPPRRRATRKTATPEAPRQEDQSDAQPAEEAAKPRRRRAAKTAGPVDATPEAEADRAAPVSTDTEPEDADQDDPERRRRRRGRRGRGRARGDDDTEHTDTDVATAPPEETSDPAQSGDDTSTDDTSTDEDDTGSGTKRRRRRRRRGGDGDSEESTAPPSAPAGRGRDRSPDRGGDDVQGVRGSTRLEAKRQRRRDGRDQGRRRAPILSESEFLARRESVDRVMAVRQHGERTQIAVLEDDVLVEHYVTKASSMSFAGNVYLGRVQNVLSSMEAAFIDIGKGRNAVLYAGEVNWDAAGLAGKSRSIEQALKSGDPVLVQVSKDPIGQKGARLTSQISLPGRYLVYVPNGSMTGISRKLPDTERQRLKDILKKIVPEDAGVIIRTAAEGASEEELTRDVNRLKAQWEVIQEKSQKSGTSAPALLYEEPDLAIRVVRDVFNEDFTKLVVSGEEAWDTLQGYVSHVAPDLAPRLSRHTTDGDLFADLRVDEQLAKAMDRKVYLPSGGSLVIDRTEAMTVIDVNTGKFIGSGGNLEQTVTRNNLEAAEEIVRQLRLRDIGGILVIDFIDMVLESNRDLVMRRLTECLGRDRTKHQVAEVTSLGLVQMTRKRVGQGLLEAFSEPCEVCNGRGLIVHTEPVEDGGRKRGGGGGRDRAERADRSDQPVAEPAPAPTPKRRRAARTAEPAAADGAASQSAEPVADGTAPQAAESAADGAVSQAGEPASGNGAAARAADSSTVVASALDPDAAVSTPGQSQPASGPGGDDGTPRDAAPARRRRRGASRPAGPPVVIP